jgi:hypothetical protein
MNTTTRPYEILIRLNDSGAGTAQQQTLLEVKDDNATLISQTVLPPTEMTLVDLKAFVNAL